MLWYQLSKNAVLTKGFFFTKATKLYFSSRDKMWCKIKIWLHLITSNKIVRSIFKLIFRICQESIYHRQFCKDLSVFVKFLYNIVIFWSPPKFSCPIDSSLKVYSLDLLFYWCKCNGFKFQDYFRIGKTRVVYKSSGGKIGNPSGGRGVLLFHVGRTWSKLAVTSSNQFLPVVVHDKWTV